MGAWTDATCTLCVPGIQGEAGHDEIYQPPPALHNNLPPPLQPACPQYPAAGGDGGRGYLSFRRCVRCDWQRRGGGGSVVLEEAALGDRLIGRLIRQWRSEARCRRRSAFFFDFFCCYCFHLLTFRSLCTMPFTWQWFTLSRICCMQWLWRRKRPGQKQKRRGRGRTGKCQWTKKQEQAHWTHQTHEIQTLDWQRRDFKKGTVPHFGKYAFFSRERWED